MFRAVCRTLFSDCRIIGDLLLVTCSEATPALWGRRQQMAGLRTGIRPVHIISTSKMVSDYSGMMVQPHKVRPRSYSSLAQQPPHQRGPVSQRWQPQ